MDRTSLMERIRFEINCASAENVSDTPDFILAEFLTECLDAFDKATKTRDEWYGNRKSLKKSNKLIDIF